MEPTPFKTSEAFWVDVRRDLLYALSRFGTRVVSVRVRLHEVTNPLGGFETLCRLDARLRSAGMVRVQILDGHTAIERAIARLGRQIEATLLDGSSPPDSDLLPIMANPTRPPVAPRRRLPHSAGKAASRKHRKGTSRRRTGAM